mgnify:CR=1 FL=1
MSREKPPLKQSPRFWALCFLLWFIVMNLLSHGHRFHPPGTLILFGIPHVDKVVHFGYFFGGGGLLAAALFFSKRPNWMRLTLLVTVTLSLIGIWDEYHQSFFENRSGNDPGDWFFDTLGAFCGAWVFRLTQGILLGKDRESFQS